MLLEENENEPLGGNNIVIMNRKENNNLMEDDLTSENNSEEDGQHEKEEKVSRRSYKIRIKANSRQCFAIKFTPQEVK